MGLPKEQCAEWKKGHPRCCCSPVWVTNGGRILWSVTAICETFKISCLMGRHHTKGGSECPSKAWSFRLAQWLNITLFLRKTSLDCMSLEQSLARYMSRLCIIRGENLERRHYGRRHWRIGGDGRIWTPRPKAQCKGSANAAQKWKHHIPSRRWNSQNLWERTASENIHLNPGTSGTRRRTRISSRKVRWVTFSNPTSRRLDAGWWGS